MDTEHDNSSVSFYPRSRIRSKVVRVQKAQAQLQFLEVLEMTTLSSVTFLIKGDCGLNGSSLPVYFYVTHIRKECAVLIVVRQQTESPAFTFKLIDHDRS